MVGRHGIRQSRCKLVGYRVDVPVAIAARRARQRRGWKNVVNHLGVARKVTGACICGLIQTELAKITRILPTRKIDVVVVCGGVGRRRQRAKNRLCEWVLI